MRRTMTLGALVLGLLLGVTASAQFAPSAETARPLAVGNRAPAFTAARVRLAAEELWKAAAPFAPNAKAASGNAS